MASDIVFTIEGLGVGSTQRQLYFARGNSPSWDSNNAWVESCWSKMPGEIESSISFLDGGTTIGGLTLEVFAEAKAQQGQTLASMLYNQTRVSIGTLQADITSTSGSISLGAAVTGLAGTHICLGREVILLVSHSGSGVYVCTRGRWGTTASSHSASDFAEVFSALAGPVLRYRQVTLYRVDLDAASAYSSLEQLGVFVIYAITAPSPEVIRIECDSMISMFEKGTILNDLWRSPVTEVVTTVRTAPNTPDVTAPSLKARQEKLRSSSATATFSIDGEAVIKPTVQTQGGNHYVIQGFNNSDIVRDLDASPRVQVLPDQPKEGWECFVCSDDDTDIDALPLSRNLLTLLLQVLTTSKSGTNGDYDLGIEDLGMAIPSTLIDVAKIEQTRAELGSLLDQDLMVLGLDGEPLEVFGFFKEALLPYGVVICDSGGLLSVASLSDNDPDAITITETADILGPASTPQRGAPAQTRRMDLAMDAISVSFMEVPGFDPVVDTLVDGERRRLTIYGADTPRALSLRYIKSRDRLISTLLPYLQRFHDDIPQITITVLRTRAAELELGDLIKVTHSKIYSALDGVRGVTGELMLITSRVLSLEENTITLTLLDVGAIYTLTSVIGPSALVESGSSGTTINIAEDFADGGFQSGLISAFPLDVSSFSVGDVIQHCDQRGVKIQGLTVTGFTTAPSSLLVSSTPSPLPVAGDVIRLERYSPSGNASAKERFAYIADTSGTLNPTDSGKEYTL